MTCACRDIKHFHTGPGLEIGSARHCPRRSLGAHVFFRSFCEARQGVTRNGGCILAVLSKIFGRQVCMNLQLLLDLRQLGSQLNRV